MNRVILMGNIGHDAELRYTGDGTPYCTFSVATTEKFKDKETTEWHKCTLWKREKLAPYLTKGTKVLVEGKVETRSYEKDGETRHFTGIKVFNVEFAGGGQRQQRSESSTPSSYADQQDDIPF